MDECLGVRVFETCAWVHASHNLRLYTVKNGIYSLRVLSCVFSLSLPARS